MLFDSSRTLSLAGLSTFLSSLSSLITLTRFRLASGILPEFNILNFLLDVGNTLGGSEEDFVVVDVVDAVVVVVETVVDLVVLTVVVVVMNGTDAVESDFLLIKGSLFLVLP